MASAWDGVRVGGFPIPILSKVNGVGEDAAPQDVTQTLSSCLDLQYILIFLPSLGYVGCTQEKAFLLFPFVLWQEGLCSRLKPYVSN